MCPGVVEGGAPVGLVRVRVGAVAPRARARNVSGGGFYSSCRRRCRLRGTVVPHLIDLIQLGARIAIAKWL